MSCEDSAWLVIEWAVRGFAVLAWCAIWFGIAVSVLFAFGKFKWVNTIDRKRPTVAKVTPRRGGY